MKDFDIEKAKAGAPVCTREGRKVRIVCFDVKNNVFPILALAENPNGTDEDIMTYTRDGKYYNQNLGFEQSVDDLIMPTLKHEGWVNIFKGQFSLGEPMVFGPIWSDEEFARNNAHGCIVTTDGKPDKEYITTIHIEWEE